jgi:hypothetical protein
MEKCSEHRNLAVRGGGGNPGDEHAGFDPGAPLPAARQALI